MTSSSSLAERLSELLGLDHPPVAVSFHERRPAGESVGPEPAGCCFWAPAENRRIVTHPQDHAGCSVGSYVHGLVPLQQAAQGGDVAALIDRAWVTPADLAAAPTLNWAPGGIVYEPLRDADDADVVLIRLDPRALMTLQGAIPDIELAGKPQCQIVARAAGGDVVVSPGCAVSRVRTGLPAGELTVALPGRRVRDIVAALTKSVMADQAVARYAASGLAAPELAASPGAPHV